MVNVGQDTNLRYVSLSESWAKDRGQGTEEWFRYISYIIRMLLQSSQLLWTNDRHPEGVNILSEDTNWITVTRRVG